MADIVSKLAEHAQSKLARVRGLVELYEKLAGPIAGRPSVQESDVLRAAVVFLHATLQDFLRSLAVHRLPSATREVWEKIPPISGEGRKTTLTLGDLHDYRGRSIDDFARDSIERHLTRSNYNNPGDLKKLLAEVGLDGGLVDPHAARLSAMMNRRHLIAHRFDQNSSTGRGHHVATSWARPRSSAGSKRSTSLSWMSCEPSDGTSRERRSIMIESRQFEAILQESFRKALRNPQVSTVYAGWDATGWGELSKALVTVVSPDYEGMDEGRRQELVWERILADLSEEEQEQIEFVFTTAPSELDEDDPRRQSVQAVGSNQPGEHG